LVAVGTVGMLIASTLPAAAADGPSPVGDGALLLEQFDDMSAWTTLTAAVDEWTTADGTVSIDTRGQSSGRYIRPTASLTLPAQYELRTSIRIEELQPQATVSFLLDMLDPGNFKTKDLAVQLVPGA